MVNAFTVNNNNNNNNLIHSTDQIIDSLQQTLLMAEEAGVYRGPKCVLQAEKCLNLCRFISLLIFALIPWAKNVIILHCWISLATKTMTSQRALLSVLWYHLRNDLHILDRRLDFGHAASLILVIDVVLSSKGQPLSSIWFKLQFSM